MDITNSPVNVELIDTSVTPDKPFNKCLHCTFLRNGCSGPNLLAMEYSRMWEFLELVRLRLGWSYSKISDITGIAVGNVKKNMLNQVKDASLHTVRSISNALLGDPNGKAPCALDYITTSSDNDTITQLTIENEKLRSELLQVKLYKDWLERDWNFKRDRLETQDLIIKHLVGKNEMQKL